MAGGDARHTHTEDGWRVALRDTLEQRSYRTVRASHRTVWASKFWVVTAEETGE